jgi:geranylgeranyl diphosphate synthase type II
VYLKDLHGDVREGKRTLMLIHLLHNALPTDRGFVEAFVADPPERRSDQRVRRVVALMREYGSVEFATDYAASIAASAGAAFDDAFGSCRESPALAFLRALVSFMVERDA